MDHIFVEVFFYAVVVVEIQIVMPQVDNIGISDSDSIGFVINLQDDIILHNFSITNFNKIFWLDVLFVTYIFTKGDNVFQNVDDEAVELFFQEDLKFDLLIILYFGIVVKYPKLIQEVIP